MLHGSKPLPLILPWGSAPNPAKGLSPFRIPLFFCFSHEKFKIKNLYNKLFISNFSIEKFQKSKGILKGDSPLTGCGAEPRRLGEA
jgi:hypothetical protein